MTEVAEESQQSAAEAGKPRRHRAKRVPHPQSITAFGERHCKGKTWIYAKLNAGELKAVKMGNETRITPESERQLMEGLPAYKPRGGKAE